LVITKYKYNITTGKVSFKFDFNAEQTILFKEAYGYPQEETMPLEVFFIIHCVNDMDRRMKSQWKSKKQTEIDQEADLAVDVSPEEDV
jgi:hypothetical protein